MTKPVFSLTWDPEPIPPHIKQRFAVTNNSPLIRLGKAFSQSHILSPPLLMILDAMRQILLYSHTCKETPTIVRDSDHDFFRVFNCEVEHQLLSYIYPQESPTSTPFTNSPLDLHPVETVIRIAAICYLNHFLIILPPSTGIARALTRHLKTAIEDCTLGPVPKEQYGLLAWALFIGAQGSVGQVERPWFVGRLAHICLSCDWHDWDQVSSLLEDYIYLPSANGIIWGTVWNEVALLLASSLNSHRDRRVLPST